MCSIDMWLSDSSSSESSNEDDWTQVRRERRRIRDNTNPLEMPTNEFISNFRLNKEAFLDILTEIDDKLKKVIKSTSTPNILKLAITLKFCAHGSYQTSFDKEGSFGLAQATVSIALSEVFSALEKTICPQYISFYYSDTEVNEAKSYFQKESGIPGVIGCIDAFHVKIKAPEKKLQHLYYNSKEYYSVKAMIVCDHKKVIRFVNAKHPGSCEDAMIFDLSPVKVELDKRYKNGIRNTWLIGDLGYPLQPYLMTPYRKPRNSSHKYYNEMHAKAMSTIDSTIRMLKNRFKCLNGEKALHYTPEKSTQIINVCVALHNICCAFNVQLSTVDFNEYSDDNNSEDLDYVEDNIAAESIRREVANSLVQQKM